MAAVSSGHSTSHERENHGRKKQQEKSKQQKV
jgi:hypothetical protein